MKNIVNYIIGIILIISIFMGLHYLVGFLADIVSEYIIAFVLIPVGVILCAFID